MAQVHDSQLSAEIVESRKIASQIASQMANRVELL